MAEEPILENKKRTVFDLDDTSIETVYANTTNAIVGEGDITLYFGFQPIEGNDIPASGVKRITMTHDSFMRMMEYWAARYRFLETLYDGKPKTLHGLDPNVISAAFDTMYGRTGKDEKTNETISVSSNKSESPSPTSTP